MRGTPNHPIHNFIIKSKPRVKITHLPSIQLRKSNPSCS
jgi:hypothetical protein